MSTVAYMLVHGHGKRVCIGEGGVLGRRYGSVFMVKSSKLWYDNVASLDHWIYGYEALEEPETLGRVCSIISTSTTANIVGG